MNGSFVLCVCNLLFNLRKGMFFPSSSLYSLRWINSSFKTQMECCTMWSPSRCMMTGRRWWRCATMHMKKVATRLCELIMTILNEPYSYDHTYGSERFTAAFIWNMDLIWIKMENGIFSFHSVCFCVFLLLTFHSPLSFNSNIFLCLNWMWPLKPHANAPELNAQKHLHLTACIALHCIETLKPQSDCGHIYVNRPIETSSFMQIR